MSRYANFAPYYDQMRIGTLRLMKDRNLKKACTLYQDDEYGLEVVRGAEAGLKLLNLEVVERPLSSAARRTSRPKWPG